MGIKNQIKEKLPDPCVEFIRNLKRNLKIKLYLVGNQFCLKKNIKKTLRKISKGEKIKVLFIAQFPEMWNSVKSLYEFLLSDNRFQTCIYAVPKKNNETKSELYQSNDMFDFCKIQSLQAVNAYQNEQFIDIEDDVDFIFIQRPYDIYMPSLYHLKNLSHKSLICFVPYYASIKKGFHIKTEMNDDLLCHCYSVFADCKEVYDYIEKWKHDYLFAKHKKIYDIGFPRFDLVRPVKKEREPQNVFLWLPRWTFNNEGDISHFLDYIDVLLDYFVTHSDHTLIIRPHPLMFSNFIEQGVMTEEQVSELKQKISQIENIEFDLNKDYLITFNKCDFLISDYTSLLLEFFFTGKPIIFCDHISPDELTTNAKHIAETFYHIRNADELISSIEALHSGKDDKKELRINILKNTMKADGNAGQKIAETILNDLSI